MRILASIIVVAACKKTDDTPPPRPTGSPPLAEKAFYRLDVGPQTPCRQRQPCEARVVLTALGDYHVNDRYPNKFVFDNTNAAAITTAGDGSFELETAKAGTWTMMFRATKAGTYTFKGTFKLGVCTDQHCETDSPEIAFETTVL